jgi:hypothetical protein
MALNNRRPLRLVLYLFTVVLAFVVISQIIPILFPGL